MQVMDMQGFSYMLAPIEDMTSCSFRAICHKYGADLTFTEMINLEGLAKQNLNTWSRLELKDDTPTVIQILGEREVFLKQFLKKFKPKKGFKGFNLNAGCPHAGVVKLQQGCSLVRRISKSRKLVDMFKDHGFPISVKMRLGLTKEDKEKKIYLNFIDAVDADFFIVHARHAGQLYNEPADFSIYEECVKQGKNIVANGDIQSSGQIELLKSAGVKGAMIGRAAISNPSLFNQLKGISCPPKEKIIEEYLKLWEEYKEPFRYRKNVLKWNNMNNPNNINPINQDKSE